MADYASSVLVKGQAIANAKFNKPELRAQMPSILEMSLQNQSISIPDAQKLRVSPLRPVEVNYFSNIAPGVATAKAYNHTGPIGDSNVQTPQYLQTVETFSMPLKLGVNNVMDHASIFSNMYAQRWRNLRTRQDNLALAYLYSNRNQLSAATMATRLASAGLGANWDDTFKALLLTDPTLFIAQLKSAMLASYYTDEIDVVSDLQMATIFEKYMNQGSGNFSNTSYQFAGCNFVRTQQNIDSNYTSGTTLALPKGMFAGLCWNEQANVKGYFEDEGGNVGILTTATDPYGSGAVCDISMYSQRADTSANTTGGSPQDIVLEVEMTLTMGYVLPALTTANDSVVMEVVNAPSIV